MKFESPIGIDEICVYGENNSPRRSKTEDILVKVIEIQFRSEGITYIVEHIGGQFGVQRFACEGSMLQGDSDFDQETGRYPEETDQ